MQYRRTPLDNDNSLSKTFVGYQITTLIDVIKPSLPHTIQSKQSSNNLDANNIQNKLKFCSLSYALYFGPRKDLKARWVAAIVTKRLGSRIANNRMPPRGPT